MKFLACFFALSLAPQEGDRRGQVHRLIERLRSDDVEERALAEGRLRELGARAGPALRKAANSGDPELATRARYLLGVIELNNRLTPRLRKAVPDAESRLITDKGPAWTALFIRLTQKYDTLEELGLDARDLDPLAALALAHAKADKDREHVMDRVGDKRLRSAAPELISLLDNDRFRDPALKILAKWRANEAAPKLTALLDHEEEEVRKLAAWALGGMRASAPLPKIVPLLSDPRPGVRRMAVVVLGNLGDRRVIEDVLPLLGDADARVRGGAVQALSRLKADESADRIEKLLKDPEKDVRLAAVSALGNLNSRDSIPALEILVDDPDPEVRRSATTELSRLGVENYSRILAGELGRKERNAVWNALQAIIRLNDRERIPEILALVQSSGDPEIRKDALRALADLGAKECIPALSKLLVKKESKISWQTIRTLKHLDAREALIHALRAEYVGARSEAAEALGDLGAREAVSDLRRHLKDDNSNMRRDAAIALGKLGAPEALPDLHALLSDKSGSPRRGAVQAIGKIARRTDAAKIVPLLKDEQSSVVREALLALAAFEAKEAFPEIVPLLDHPTPSIRGYASRCLGRLDPGRARNLIRPLLGDFHPGVRSYAAYALCRLGDRRGAEVLIAERERDEFWYFSWNDETQGVGEGNDPVSLLVLHALRDRNLWSRVEDAKFEKRNSGRIREDIREVARLLGLELKVSPDVAERSVKWRGPSTYWWRGVPAGTPLTEALKPWIRNSRLELLIEGTCLRVVTVEEAIRFWKNWLKEP